MMRGVIVLIVAAMAWLFLKKPQYKHHLMSLTFIFIGVFLVGLSSFIFPKEGASAGDTSPVGIILLLVS